MSELSDEGKELFERGTALRHAGDFGGAADAFRRVVEIDSTCAPAWAFLGNCLEHLESYEEAVNAYELAVAASPRSGLASGLLFHGYIISNDLVAAVAELERYFALVVDDAHDAFLSEFLHGLARSDAHELQAWFVAALVRIVKRYRAEQFAEVLDALDQSG